MFYNYSDRICVWRIYYMGCFVSSTFLLEIFSITFHFIPNFYKILTLTSIQGWIWQMIVIKNIIFLECFPFERQIDF